MNYYLDWVYERCYDEIRCMEAALGDAVSSMCHRATLLALLVLFVGLGPAQGATSIARERVWVAGVAADVITIDLNDPDICVTPAVARWGIGHSESFRSMMRRMRPAAAINGTFFDTRTLKPTGDIVIEGTLLCMGDCGVAITITEKNKIKFIPSRHPDMYQRSDYECVLVGGPTLVTTGKAIVVPRDEGFRSGVHFSRRIRAAVGLTSSNKLLFVTTRGPVYLGRLAKAMRSLKCVEAAALDGGSSVGLYCKGKLIRKPSRGMTNCLLVYESLGDYNRRRQCLFPTANSASVSRPNL